MNLVSNWSLSVVDSQCDSMTGVYCPIFLIFAITASYSPG